RYLPCSSAALFRVLPRHDFPCPSAAGTNRNPMAESALVSAARGWVVDKYPYNRQHLLRSLERLDELAPGSAEAVRLATLTHDMERAFPGPDSPKMSTLHDPEYERLHSERSARIVGEWLRAQLAPARLVEEV